MKLLLFASLVALAAAQPGFKGQGRVGIGQRQDCRCSELDHNATRTKQYLVSHAAYKEALPYCVPIDCVYIIVAPRGDRIVVNFDDLHTKKNEHFVVGEEQMIPSGRWNEVFRVSDVLRRSDQKEFTTTSSVLRITFKAQYGDDRDYYGWKISFASENNPTAPVIPHPPTPIQKSDCQKDVLSEKLFRLKALKYLYEIRQAQLTLKRWDNRFNVRDFEREAQKTIDDLLL